MTAGRLQGAAVSQATVAAVWLDIVAGYNGGDWDGRASAPRPSLTRTSTAWAWSWRSTPTGRSTSESGRCCSATSTATISWTRRRDGAVLRPRLGRNLARRGPNYDLFVDFGDATVLFGALGQTFDPGFAPAAVPEPSTLLLMIVGVGVLVVRILDSKGRRPVKSSSRPTLVLRR